MPSLPIYSLNRLCKVNLSLLTCHNAPPSLNATSGTTVSFKLSKSTNTTPVVDLDEADDEVVDEESEETEAVYDEEYTEGHYDDKDVADPIRDRMEYATEQEEEENNSDDVLELQINERLDEFPIPVMISNARKEQQAEIEFLEKKLQEAQIKITEKDQAKDNEIQSLKNIVSELQFRLKHEQNNGFSLTEELKKEYDQKSADLKRVTEEHDDLMSRFTQVQEENTFLQETVRRECEERFELTEALTVAREQLLQLKKIDGNRPLSNALANQTIPSVIVKNNHQKHYTGPLTGKDAKHRGHYGELGPVSASSAPEHRLNVSALPSLHPPRGRASSVTEARKRITAILRQSSSKH